MQLTQNHSLSLPRQMNLDWITEGVFFYLRVFFGLVK